MRLLNKMALFITLLITLQGCGSSPSVRFYALEPLAIEYATDPEGAAVLGLGPLRIPDYLHRSQLVTRGYESELVIDEYNRWAEPLSTAVHRTLANNVDALLDTVAVVSFPSTASVDYRLVGQIQRFEVDARGIALLDVQWRVEDANGEELTPPRRSSYEHRASRRDDPEAGVAALNEMLGQFSRDIAAGVQGLIAIRQADRDEATSS